MCNLDSSVDTFELHAFELATAMSWERAALSAQKEYEYVPDVLMLLNRMDAPADRRLQLDVMRSELYST